jgi:hypothetical protein
MAQLSPAKRVKLFVATLHSDLIILQKAIEQLTAKWGKTDFESPDFPFDATDYYEKEMGTNLYRRFYSFSKLISLKKLSIANW